MVSALLVLDGAPQPGGGDGPLGLDAAMPVLEGLCARGTVALRNTTPAGLEPGTETCLPGLLGAPLAGRPSRGALEAAAAGIPVHAGERAWRLDLHEPGGRRCSEAEAALLVPVLRRHLPRHVLHHLRGHRLLAVGTHPPQVSSCAGLDVVVWPDGIDVRPQLAGRPVAVVAARGAAAGLARLLGADVRVPEGATGDVDTDLEAKAQAALAVLDEGLDAVVHVGGADEAAHRLDGAGRRAFLEEVDARLILPISQAGVALQVTADHATCATTGRHDAGPVACLTVEAGG